MKPLLLLLVSGVCAFAQFSSSAPPGAIVVSSNPNGNSCVTASAKAKIYRGTIYVCPAGTYVAVGGGASSNQGIRTIGVAFDGAGAAISGSITRCAHVSYAGTIQAATIIADQSGSATIDVKTVAYSSYTGPSSTSSIAASAIPALSSTMKYQDTTLTGWTTALAANTEVCFALTSPSTITWAQITLKVAAN